MKHSHIGGFVVVAILAYLALKYWSQIKSAVPVLGLSRVVPAISNPPADGFSAAFGNGPNFMNPIPNGPGLGVNSPLNLGGPIFRNSNVGPLQTDESASGNPFVFVNLGKAFGSGCSTHLWDGKPLCA